MAGLAPALRGDDEEGGLVGETVPKVRRLWLPLAVAALVLVLAAILGYGLAQVVAQVTAAPGPRTTLPPATATPSPSPTPTPTPIASPEPSPTVGPTPTPIIHVVARGEYLTLIAERYGVSVEAILEANDILDPNYVEVGQRLVIPAPSPDATAVPSG